MCCRELKKDKEPEREEQGVLKYALSERKFINKGWTMLPTEKVIRRMHVYRMRPSHPEFDWFENNKAKGQMVYNTGEKLAEFIEDGGGGCLFYKTGNLALDYYKAEESNVGQRYVVYSDDDEEVNDGGRSRSRTILATFDFLGNGVVFDHAGKIRLKYNQTEGVVLDRGIGPASHWKWHTLNDPPALQQVMIDTHSPHKDPRLLKITQDHGDSNKAKRAQSRDDDMLAIEFSNFVKEKSKKIKQTYKPFQVKLKALKINEKFSLRILDQATVYLIFRDGPNSVKMNIGMVLDQKEILDTVTAEVGDCSVSVERLPAGSDSVAALQRAVAAAQRRDRARARRQQRLYPSVAPAASADRLWTLAAASRPPRLPLITCSCTISTIHTEYLLPEGKPTPTNPTMYSVVPSEERDSVVPLT